MNRSRIPDHVQGKLARFERNVAELQDRLAATEQGIGNARERLTGGFERDADYRAMDRALDGLLADKVKLEDDLHCARDTLSECRDWLAQLPNDVELQAVKARSNGLDLDALRSHIRNCESEVARLAAVPVPPEDVEDRVKQYVAGLARPRVRNLDGGPLEVTWPDSTPALLAFLLPEQMTAALLKECNRLCNAHGSPTQRQRRIAELHAEIDALQRQALALGEDAIRLRPEVVLGVRLVQRPNQPAAVERRRRATSAA